MRIVLADDHAILRRGLSILLTAQAGITVVASVANGREACEAVLRLRPDVVIMVISMPRLNGCEATTLIKAS